MLPGMDLGQKLWQVADELRGIASEGLTWCEDAYQRRRYERVMRLAAELAALQDPRPEADLERLFRADLFHVCPWIGANAAIFDETGRILLIQRKDDGLWAMPGGLLEIGETPSEGARRETLEETGLEVVTKAVAGLYDWGLAGGRSQPGHLHGYVFMCELAHPGTVPTVTEETLDVGWFEPDRLPPLSGGHRTAVPDAIAYWRDEATSAFFH